MPMKELMNQPGGASWYNPLWIATVEDNLPNILRVNNIEALTVDPIMHEHHKHNFHSFIREEITPERKYWYIIMRANGMTSPTQFDSKYDVIIYPRLKLIDDLHSAFLASLP
ncbi:hypothetical protein NRE35_004373 [Salmonella enterica]|nr:hypothetical protein [Salmonella enterica]WNT47277.1 hypothetical protein SPLA10_PHROGS00216 [Salmonella phage SPLA10]